mmetsp:Transcript_39811/g.73412  ORF Transcript_39811/g.73412 Transcript_39811/m.73412 type:complete len:144 (-) Transcript_39811:282-713(-)
MQTMLNTQNTSTTNFNQAYLLADERVLGQNQRHNKAIKTKRLRENENQDHANEKLLLLAYRTDASITNNSNCHTGSKTRKPTAQTSREVCETSVQTVLALAALWRHYRTLDDDSNNKAINAQHTRHDHWNDIPHHKARVHHTH